MKIYLDSIGCRLNQSEIELFANEFRSAGHTLVGMPDDADLVVINTCAVTNEATSDSRQKVRHAARSGAKDIILTGCWATMDQSDAMRLPGVSRIISNQKKDTLVSDILDLKNAEFDQEPLARQPLPGLRARTRAFVKIQDGCDNYCTFCITRLARGHSRSKTIKEILDDVNSAMRGHYQEIVLSGAQLGAWGQDFVPKMNLDQLITTILDSTDVQRVRLSSLEPWNLRKELFDLWEDKRLCRHFHLPLQSGSANILRHMGRRTDPVAYRTLINTIKEMIPEVAITTDIIVGFPGETDKDFEDSLILINQVGFAGGHVFTYSERPGTLAKTFTDSVPMSTRKNRNARVRAIFTESAELFRKLYLGRTVNVLWEASNEVTREGWKLTGLTDNYLRVYSSAPEPLWNKISSVKLIGLKDDGLEGIIISGQ